jgi:hypothetical protein
MIEIEDLITTKENCLCLDFDETIGSFHICYSLFSQLLFIEKSLHETIKRTIKEEILRLYHIRPYLIDFFELLNKLKKTKKIKKIFILTRNSDRNNFPGYLRETIEIIEKITNTPNLIDNIIDNVESKILRTDIYNKIYIVDDKPEHVIPTENCISVSPFIAYVSYTVYLEKMRELSISEEVIKKFSKNLHSLSKSDFDIRDRSSYTNQYSQIADFNSLYQTLGKEKIRIKENDNDLLKTMRIIDSLFT